MQPSRRRLLGAIGGAASLGLVGCLADRNAAADSNDTDGGADSNDPGAAAEPAGGDDGGASNGSNGAPSFSAEGPLLARLVGPDEQYRLFDRSAIVGVGEVTAGHDSYAVPVTISDEQTTAFLEAVQDVDLEENYDDYAVVLTVDGEVVHRSRIAVGLARDWDSREWDGRFLIQAPTERAAHRLRESLV